MAAATSTRKPTIVKKLVTRNFTKLELTFFGFVVIIGASVLLVVEFVALLSVALLSITVVAGSVVTPSPVWALLLPASAEPLSTTVKLWPVFLLELVLVPVVIEGAVLVLVPGVADGVVLVLVLVPVVAGGAVLAGGVVVPAGGVGVIGVGVGAGVGFGIGVGVGAQEP